MADKGYLQHPDKQIAVTGYRGNAAVKCTQDAMLGYTVDPANVARAARYLGARVACVDATHDEISCRVVATRKAWRYGGET